jgi:hypothetical protein
MSRNVLGESIGDIAAGKAGLDSANQFTQPQSYDPGTLPITSDGQFASKKYVDDSISGAGGGDMLKT